MGRLPWFHRIGRSCGIGLACVALIAVAGCNSGKPKTAALGKGGLPTNNMEGVNVAGTAGAAIVVPEELMYPGSVEVEGRPSFYNTNTATATVKEWILANVPGVAQINEENKRFQTFRGQEWTIELYDHSGTATVRYMPNKYLYKD